MSKRKASYDLVFNLKAVKCAEEKTKEAAAREFRVDPCRIHEWCQQNEKLVDLKKQGKSKRKRLEGGERKADHEDMKEVLFGWIVDIHTCMWSKPQSFAEDDTSKAKRTVNFRVFHGQLGLVVQMFESHETLSQAKTTVCQSLPTDGIPKIVSFITHLRNLQLAHKFQYEKVFAMDETACWMDMSSDTTIEATASCSIPLKTTSHKKNHFTAVLTAKLNEAKLKPFVVFKGKGTCLIKDLQCIPGKVVHFSLNGWMNGELTVDYFQTIIGMFSFSKCLLVWGTYK